MADEIAYRRLRAPREDGQVLVDPAIVDLPGALQANRQQRWLFASRLAIQGESLAEFAADARRELVTLAKRYTSQYVDLAELTTEDDAPLLMAGHQPQLFHAGVWYKNFVLSAVARQTGAVAINLVVDNDTSRTATIRVPTGDQAAPRVENLPLDLPSAEIPFEERPILDPALFASFAQRTTAALQGWIEEPLVNTLWPAALQHAQQGWQLGTTLAAARHALEHAWGLRTLEIPLSQVCDTRSFATFALHLLTHLPQLHETYNSALAEYRRANHLRSHSHPVPDLHAEASLREAPLWIWTADEPRRRPLFVDHRRDELLLTNRANLSFTLPLTASGEADERTVAAWLAARRQGIKIRPRALVTTLYSRLVLSDLFLHGIGGAKYDQLTDALFGRFFQIAPPIFGTVTATVKLPIPRPSITSGQVEAQAHEVRELPYHPEVYLNEGLRSQADVAAMVAEKQHLLATQPPKGARLNWHRALEQVNARLFSLLTNRREEMQQQLAIASSELRRGALLGSREFAFCLFPEESLRGQLLDLSAHAL